MIDQEEPELRDLLKDIATGLARDIDKKDAAGNPTIGMTERIQGFKALSTFYATITRIDGNDNTPGGAYGKSADRIAAASHGGARRSAARNGAGRHDETGDEAEAD